MAVKVLELHHHGIRVGPSQEEVAKARKFYGDVLGLDHDPGRPNIPTIDGYWMDVGGTAQIHLMGVNGQSKFADIQETRKELDRLGVKYWVAESVVGPQSQQIFMKDPFDNMIELHQIDACRCVTARRPAAGGGKMA
jgi:hypothetical protein